MDWDKVMSRPDYSEREKYELYKAECQRRGVEWYRTWKEPKP